MTRIKCCGMTRVEDALLAAQLGADAIGLVFAARSRRCITLEQAVAIRRALPPFVTAVAVFLDDEAALVRDVIAAVQPDVLQFHGNEPDEWCAQFGQRYLKTIAMGAGAAVLPRLYEYPRACALLLDGHGLGELGGDGKAFDWSLLPKALPQPLILAGGLTCANVAQAIGIVHPWAVDVASGVEVSPGRKDLHKMRAFIQAVHGLANG